MKKKTIIIVIMSLIILSNYSFALTKRFKDILEISGINRYNNQGYEINEEIYYKYNQIVYGTPELAINEPSQRWKNVSNGLWEKDGKKGEYRILGYNYIGNVVNNHEFPNDVTPSSSPLEWTYVYLPDALSSWNNKSLAKYKEVKEYMQNTNLYRDNIEYDINCNTIGLDKARLDNCSTIFTSGTIYTNRLDPYGKVWEATFTTKPMDEDIKFEVEIIPARNVYTIQPTQDYVDIPVKIAWRVITSNPELKENYIKKIRNDIYVDNYAVGRVEKLNSMSSSKDIIIRIYRSDYPSSQGKSREYTLDFKLRSICFTCFPNDLPIYSKSDKKVKLVVLSRAFMKQDMIIEKSPYLKSFDESYYEYPEYVENKDKDENEEKDEENEQENKNNKNFTEGKIQLFNIEKENNEKIYSNLSRTVSTDEAGSIGYIKAGTNLGIKIKADSATYKVVMSFEGDKSINTFDEKTKKFEWDDSKEYNYETRFNSLQKYYDFYNSNYYEMNNYSDNIYVFEYLIPYETKQTLYAWNSLRDEEENSFNIDQSKIFTRKDQPYKIRFDIYRLIEEETEDGVKTYTEIVTKYAKFDVFECWNNLYNRDLSKYNINDGNRNIKYEDWIKDYE